MVNEDDGVDENEIMKAEKNNRPRPESNPGLTYTVHRLTC